MDFLNNNDYCNNVNFEIIELITNTIIPYVSQFENISIQNYYIKIINILIEVNYTYEEIYFALGFFLLNIKDNIENDMTIIKNILYNSIINQNNIINLINNFIIPVINIENEYESVKLTVSKEEINKLPLKNFYEIKTDEKTCSICLEDFIQECKIREINCKHLFHSECIDKWLFENNYKCPICRENIAKYKINI